MNDQAPSASMREMTIKAFLFWIIVLASGCQQGEETIKRWYTAKQVEKGKAVFVRHCAACHGSRAQGPAEDWRLRRPDGSYPPPPLDGTAHAWHHTLPLLVEIIQKGGALYDGKMPGFADSLSKEEQLAAIAWFQSLWNDDVYRRWAEAEDQRVQQGGKP